MIRSFGDRETEKIFEGQVSRRLPADIQATARRKLFYLNNALNLPDLLAPPGNRLEALKGNRLGQHSIRINDQWRICFLWVAGTLAENSPAGAYGVEIVDYH